MIRRFPNLNKEIFCLEMRCRKRLMQTCHALNLKIGENSFRLFTIWYQEKLSDLDIDIEHRIIDLSPYFIGDKDSEFIVTLKNEEREYCLHTPLTSTFVDTIIDDEYHGAGCPAKFLRRSSSLI